MHGVRYSWIGILAAVGVLACSPALAADETAAKTEPAKATAAAPAKAKAAPAAKAKGKAMGQDEVAVLETTKGRMIVEFWPKEAPKTVARFKALAKSGFYNGTGFHRIMKNFMIQGGDPKSKNPKAPDLGTGGSGQTIPDEYNSHPHVKGVLSMASSGTGTNSGDSQFFVVHGNANFLDGKYTAFGHVTKGLDVIDAIASVPVGPNPMMNGEPSKPLQWVTLKSVKIMPKAEALGGGAKASAAAPGSKSAAKPATKTAAKPAEPAKTEAKAPESAAAGEAPPAAGGAPADSSAAK